MLARGVDLHNHLLPGVDDGARDLAESLEAVEALRRQGVEGAVVTPHLKGSLTRRPEAFATRLAALDAAWEEFRARVSATHPGFRLGRGVELMLDVPDPDLSDPRVRLAGTPFVLVEFPFFSVPPGAPGALGGLLAKGWVPVVAHAERYEEVAAGLEIVAGWRAAGARVQVNCGALLGRFGAAQKRAAAGLLERGWVDYLASDHHARGVPDVAGCAALLEGAGAGEAAALLLRRNPERLLEGKEPLPVPGVRLSGEGWRWWKTLLGRR